MQRRSYGRITQPFPYSLLELLAHGIVDGVVRLGTFLTDWLLSRRFLLKLREQYFAQKYLQTE